MDLVLSTAPHFNSKGKERYSLVFHKQTNNYYITYDLEQDRVQEYVKELISTGHTVNVVAGIKILSNSVRHKIVAYESTTPVDV